VICRGGSRCNSTSPTSTAGPRVTAFVWLLGSSRRQALIFAVSMIAIVTGIGPVISHITNGGFWFHVIAANVKYFDYLLELSTGFSLATGALRTTTRLNPRFARRSRTPRGRSLPTRRWGCGRSQVSRSSSSPSS
jgi:hypothetical protein